MAVIKIEFSTDAPSYESVHAQQQTFLAEKLLPFLVKNDLDFRLSQNFLREKEEDSDFILLVKCSSSYVEREIKSFLYGEPGVTFQTYPDCEIPFCYEQIAAQGVEKLTAPLFNRHGEEAHAIHCYCQYHLKPQDRAILRTIETLDEIPTKGSSRDRWVKILVWSQRGKWYAQCVQNDWDGDWEHGYQEEVYGSPWQVRKTREDAIAAARAEV